MSKRQLNNFLNELSAAELKEQLVDLYGRFRNVKEFYDFSFNPNEEKRVEEYKVKIGKEYFPDNRRKAKKRRSIAQKAIVHLQKLEVEPSKIADLMLFAIEVAQSYTAENPIKQEAFYKSMFTSFNTALHYIDQNFLLHEFEERINSICANAVKQEWMNKEAFGNAKFQLLKN